MPFTTEPVGLPGLDAALRLFVTNLVIEDKRTQISNRLRGSARRVETLTTLARWISGRTAELEGAERSPAGLQARFGELVGVHLDEVGARRTTIAGALTLGRGTPSLFIGDTGQVAMITNASGPPILCSRV